MRVDLHCHSNASDGELSPADLFALAVDRQIDLLALTDHDSVCGYQKLRRAIDAGEICDGSALVAGVEITCAWSRIDIHLLGLGFDADFPALTTFLGEQARLRHQRAGALLAGLERAGAAGIRARFEQTLGDAIPGRLHLARLLVAAGYAPDIRRAFRRWLRPLHSPARVEWASLLDAVAIVQRSGGVAVLAHPLAYSLSVTRLGHLLADFAAAGGNGIEIAVPGYDAGQRASLAALARSHGLSASAGSDFHSPGQWRKLGAVPPLPEGIESVWAVWEAPADTIGGCASMQNMRQ